MHESAGSSSPILVVEDSDDDFDTVVEAARRAGVRNRLVRAATADAARKLLSGERPTAYAFVLLDCSLPGEDGLGLLEYMRRDLAQRVLPVVVFTASINARDREAFYTAGVNAYHVKRVRFEDCLATLQQIFGYWLTQVILPDARAADGGRRTP